MLSRALVLAGVVTHCSAWRREGTLPLSSHFAVFVGKFCIDYAPSDQDAKVAAGMVGMRVEGIVEDRGNGNRSDMSGTCVGKTGCHTSGQLYFMGFSDEAHRWERAWGLWDELDCEERLRYSSMAIPLSPQLGAKGVMEGVVPSETSVFNKTTRIIQQRRPRFWYFAMVNCGARILQPVTYEVHVWNNNSGVDAELGVDMRGAHWLESVFAVLFVSVCTAGASAAARSRKRHGSRGVRSQPLLLVLRASAALSALGCGGRAAHHWLFLYDGYGLPPVGVAGSLFACGAKLLLTVLQFFIGKGWALFASPEQATQRRMIVVALLLVMGLSAACEIRAHYFHDMDTHFYMYESWPGLLILTLNLGLLGASWLMTWDAYLSEPSPALRSYYCTVSLAAGVYFASLPVICVISGALSPWVVRKVVERTELCSRFIATVLLLVCLWPSRVDALVASRSQISLMKDVETCTEKQLGEATAPEQKERVEFSAQLD